MSKQISSSSTSTTSQILQGLWHMQSKLQSFRRRQPRSCTETKRIFRVGDKGQLRWCTKAPRGSQVKANSPPTRSKREGGNTSIGACGEEMYGRCWRCRMGKSVSGQLCSFLPFWEQELRAPPWILDTVKNRYVLPFYSLPTP